MKLNSRSLKGCLYVGKRVELRGKAGAAFSGESVHEIAIQLNEIMGLIRRLRLDSAVCAMTSLMVAVYYIHVSSGSGYNGSTLVIATFVLFPVFIITGIFSVILYFFYWHLVLKILLCRLRRIGCFIYPFN